MWDDAKKSLEKIRVIGKQFWQVTAKELKDKKAHHTYSVG